MIIKNINISNLRCIHQETLKLDALTALVGANGVGKSSFLKALELFYISDETLEEEDFHGNNTGEEAIVAITFTQLSDSAKELFKKYIEGDELTVVRVFKWNEGRVTATYHGSKLQIAEFSLVRSASKAEEMKAAYNVLLSNDRFRSLPPYGRSKEVAMQALEAWEISHPDLCTRSRDDGQFFGFKEVSAGYLGRYSRFILVPAVKDASADGEEGKGSLFTQLIDIVVRSNVAGNAELMALGEEMKKRYEDIISSTKTDELKKLGEDLSVELSSYVASSDVDLTWGSMPQVQLPPPKAIAKIGEEGHRTAIERKGHGLQRAFIMTLLQYLETVRRKAVLAHAEEDEGKELGVIPSLILGIEEPELYQHPDRQRHFANILMRLAVIAANASSPSTQVVYTTHSPHFVGLDRFENIRLARKISGSGVPKTELASVTLSDIASQLATIVGGDTSRFTSESLRVRLQTLMTPWMNEGFFARVVVLVEGEQDRAAILATAALLGKDLESIGIVVIPCLGKTNIDRPTLIFRGFRIPTYLIWDSDYEDNTPREKTNKELLKIVGATEEDYPEAVTEGYACFKKNLEATLENELTTGVMSPIVSSLQTEFETTKSDILKNPAIMTRLLRDADAQGKRSATLVSIVENILRKSP